MGNCAGILASCQGDEEQQRQAAVRHINQEAMQQAISHNKELEYQGLALKSDMPQQKRMLLAAEGPSGTGHEMRGPYQLESGAIYEGEWQGDMRDGNGK
jgi:hypothetical protein